MEDPQLRTTDAAALARAAWTRRDRAPIEAMDQARRALALEPPAAVRAGALLALAWCEVRGDEVERAAAHAAQAIDLMPGEGAPRGYAEHVLASVAWLRGAHDEARARLARALTMFRRCNHVAGQADAHLLEGAIAGRGGAHEQALIALERARDLFELIGGRPGQARALTNMANVHLERGQLERAVPLLEACVRLQRRIDDPAGLAISLNNLGRLLIRTGEQIEAVTCLRESLAISQDLGRRADEARALQNLTRLYQQRGDLAAARHWCERLLVLQRQLQDRTAARDTQLLQVELLLQTGELAAAQASLDALAVDLDPAAAPGQWLEAQHARARLLEQRGDARGALGALEVATRRAGVEPLSPELWLLRARLLRGLGDLEGAEAALDHAASVLDASATSLAHVTLWRERAQALRARGRWPQAWDALEEAQRLERERFDRDAELRMRRMQAAFEVEQARRDARRAEREAAERGRVNQELQDANRRLRQLNLGHNELLGVVAHDLRNLLVSVLSSADLLRGLDLDAPSTPRARDDLLTTIVSAGQRIERRLDEILDAQRLEEGLAGLRSLPCDLCASARASLTHLRPAALRKSIALRVDLPLGAWVLGDPHALQEICDNLVSNAIKFSPPGAEVEVSVALTAEGEVALTVRDHGPGLDAEDVGRLYEKFARLKPRPTAGEPSTGLGLYIVRQLVDALGARIGCDTAPGAGAAFCVTFSLCPSLP